MTPPIPSPEGSSSSEGQTLGGNLMRLFSSDDRDFYGREFDDGTDENEGEAAARPGNDISSDDMSAESNNDELDDFIEGPLFGPLRIASTCGRVPALNWLQQQASAPPTFYRRDALPSHYLLKIESFPALSKASVANYRSEFEAGGYKWELSIYPTGDKKHGGQDHISMFLRLVDTSSLPVGWEVNAIFTFFVFDQIRDKYVTPQDARVTMRFHSMKTKWGIPKFIDLKNFNDPSNGYLVDGTCTFGAEVFVVKNTFKGECLSAIDEPINCMYTWKVNSFSSKTLERYESNLFVGGDYKWKILLYPNGLGEGKGNSLSLFLQVDVSTLPPNTKLFVNYVLRVRHQLCGKHIEQKDDTVFSSSTGWGFRQFMSLAKFKHPENGYLVDDSCIIEAQFEAVGLIKQN